LVTHRAPANPDLDSLVSKVGFLNTQVTIHYATNIFTDTTLNTVKLFGKKLPNLEMPN
jgi:hypothetical protein